MPIHYEIKERIAFITIEGRGPYNLLNPDLVYKPLKETLLKFRDDPEVWVGVVSAPSDKKAFSLGGDLGSVSAIRNKVGDKEQHRGYNLGRERVFRPNFGTREWQDVMIMGALQVYKPMVFAINGPCVGGIFGITMANADIIVAVEDAYFGGAAIRNAIGGGSAPTDQLPWRIAMEMTLRGKSLSAQDAYRVGFVNHLVSHEELMPFSTSIAEEIAANPPLHVQASKQMTIVGRDIPPSVAALPRMLMSAFLQTTPDAAEGPKAFIEKRKAQYTGEVD